MKKSLLLLTFITVFIGCRKDNESNPSAAGGIKITAVSPLQATLGDTITITGTGFPEHPIVKFRETDAFVISATSTEIKTILPKTDLGVLRILVRSETKASNYFNITAVSNVKEANINGTIYQVDTTSYYMAGPGTKMIALSLAHSQSPLKVFILEMDRQNQYLDFKPVLSYDSVIQRESIVAMSSRKSKTGESYFAGINGDFFDIAAGSSQIGRTYQGTIIDEIVGTMPTNSTENYIIFDDTKKPVIRKLAYSGRVITPASSSFVIHDVNNVRRKDSLILYNHLNGKFTRADATGSEVTVELASGAAWGLNKDVQVKVTQTNFDAGNSAIPVGGAVLSGHGAAGIFLKTLSVGDALTIKMDLIPTQGTALNIRQLIGAHNHILNNNNFTNDNWNSREPRTAMGYSADGNKIYYVVVDGRSTVSVGVTTHQLSDILKLAGAAHGVNLDGGGSSSMFIKDIGLINMPSDGSVRAVGNAFFTVSSAPDNSQVTAIAADKYKLYLTKGQSVPLKVIGYNQYGTVVNGNLNGATISCPPALGTISGNTFTAASPAAPVSGRIEITYNNLKTSIKVLVQ